VAASAVVTVGEELVVVAEPAPRVVTLRPRETHRILADEPGASRAG
jgi:hypothetical protein